MKAIKKHQLLEKQFDIHYIHIGDDQFKGQEIVLSAGINPLSHNWMYWFDVQPGMFIADSKTIITGMVRGIRDKTEVLKDTFWS